MKRYLIDENLPATMKLQKGDEFLHVLDVKKQMSDTEIWEYAKRNNYIIITKDADFYERIINAVEPPPKIIWIRMGNMKREKLEEVFFKKWKNIKQHLDRFDLIEVYEKGIEGVKI